MQLIRVNKYNPASIIKISPLSYVWLRKCQSLCPNSVFSHVSAGIVATATLGLTPNKEADTDRNSGTA